MPETQLQTQPSKEVLFQPFEKQEEFINAVLSGNFSFVLYGGAIRGGKTIALIFLFILLSKIYPGSRWAIVRKDLPVIKRNLYPSWDKVKPTSFIKTEPSDHNQHTVTFRNASQIIFFPETFERDKDQNRWRGLEVNGFGFEEMNECQQASFSKSFERAGSYIIKGAKHQPRPIVVGTCNPTQGWVKKVVYTPWKEGTLKPTWKYIQSTIYDNKPLLLQQPHYLPSLKENLNHYEYEVFVEGNWDVQLKTGNEYLQDFEIVLHVKPVQYTAYSPVCISIDSNVYPYISLTCWQMIQKGKGWIIRQIHEMPCYSPENTASLAGRRALTWLKEIGHKEKVFLYGDYSTKSKNNIDDQKRSFYDIVEENIRIGGFRTEDKLMPHVAVASLGEFINKIFIGEIEDLEIEIGENCKESINDYIETKKDKNGAILKVMAKATETIPAHQKNGHLTDTLKDFIAQAFRDEYEKFLSSEASSISGLRGFFG